jgi:hypothetical protein
MKRLLVVLLLCGCALAQNAPAPKPVAPTPGAAATSEAFTDAVANDLLSQIATSMAARNARGMLAAFDPKLDGYGVFANNLNVWFQDNTAFKAYYKLRQTSVDDGRGVAVVDFEYEITPREEDQPPVRRHAQMRFTFERGAKGWKIVDFSPRSFFS